MRLMQIYKNCRWLLLKLINLKMNLKELSTDIVLSAILLMYTIYCKIASAVLWTFLPTVKRIVSKRMRNVKILNDRVYIRAILEGDVGVYESYVDGEWTTNDLVGTISRAMLSRKIKSNLHPLTWTLTYFNLQTRKRAWQVGTEHYDIGNDIYENMLDKNMQYTCGYWKNASNLDEAQIAKMELIAQKLKLRPGMSVLDIGCGFGTLGYYLAKNYGVRVVGCSISKEQTNYGENLCTGLPVQFRLCDYRDLNETFDRIVSVGMFEHVGPHNFKEFFQVVHRCLKDEGIFLLHTIGINHRSMPNSSMWIHKYIFPNGVIPYPVDICKGTEDLFVIEDWHNFGLDYFHTLKCWEENFDNAWPGKLSLKYGERFYRMWKLYLSVSQAVFRTRSFQLWQIVLSKDGLKEGYHAPR